MINGVILNKFNFSLSKQSPATTGGDAINRCVAIGTLPSPEPYRKMTQFRNFIVHRYEKIDTAILVEIIKRRLSDFEAFREEISKYVYRMENTLKNLAKSAKYYSCLCVRIITRRNRKRGF
jgi:uncharacterized protein YutE (UPF0331/DUF86 family)